MEPTKLRLGISRILKRHNIDDLALEAELTTGVREMYGEISKPRTPEKIREATIDALITGASAAEVKQHVLNVVTGKLNLNPSTKEGQEFLDYAYLRSKHSESIDQFASWWVRNGGEPKYWSFRRMRELWPQAFKTERSQWPEEIYNKWDKIFAAGPAPKESNDSSNPG